MDRQDCFRWGVITKAHGLKGGLRIKIEQELPEHIIPQKVFANLNNRLVPFFVESFELLHNGRGRIFFEDVTTVENAQALLGKEIHLPNEFLPESKKKDFYVNDVLGFEVVDTSHGAIGVVENVLDYGDNTLLQIINNGREILIPAADEIILNINRESKTIEVETPEGLISLNME